jgi:hypothetical protein
MTFNPNPNHSLPSASLYKLPTELHLMIFGLLKKRPVLSTCLGLTCAKLYGIHWLIQGPKRLDAWDVVYHVDGTETSSYTLAWFIRGFFPSNYRYSFHYAMFLTKEAEQRLQLNFARELEHDMAEQFDRLTRGHGYLF